jgi:hypothetical protein
MTLTSCVVFQPGIDPGLSEVAVEGKCLAGFVDRTHRPNRQVDNYRNRGPAKLKFFYIFI